MTHQVQVWSGSFGEDYTDRNEIDYRTRLPAFHKMLMGLSVPRVLEVGCNRGHNLIALTEVLGKESTLIGLEPNSYALEIARRSSTKIGLLIGHALDVPFKDQYFDLVFTVAVLIHISLPDLVAALKEIYRVSKRYILAVEYFAEEETAITYRGQEGLLWKRDFCKHYQTQFPDLVLIRKGYWGPEDGFDRTHWWLFEKYHD